jgi:hypothetical protein
MLMSAKKYIDGIAEEWTPFVVVLEVETSNVVEVNKHGCGCLQVIPNEPTITAELAIDRVKWTAGRSPPR